VIDTAINKGDSNKKFYQMIKSTIPPQAGVSKMRDTYPLAPFPWFYFMLQDSSPQKNKVAWEEAYTKVKLVKVKESTRGKTPCPVKACIC
jgi:hypothetical protein